MVECNFSVMIAITKVLLNNPSNTTRYPSMVESDPPASRRSERIPRGADRRVASCISSFCRIRKASPSCFSSGVDGLFTESCAPCSGKILYLP